MRAIFFGTPDFAVPSLEAMLESGVRVDMVVTRPDRPVGRHSPPVASPVARLAEGRGLPVAKPERVRGNDSLRAEVLALAPDVGVVVAYGRILPVELLGIPRHGFVNVHASLLPRWRGAAPVAAAILAGDPETGVVTMRVEEELDAGPLYLERRAAIGASETTATLSGRLAVEGGSLLVETLRGLAGGTLSPRAQKGEATFCRTLRREDGEADWSRPAEELERRLRAFTPWPGLFTFVGEDRIKILEARIGPRSTGQPGALRLEGGRALVSAGGGASLEVLRAQRSGRSPVSGAELARSLPLGASFGGAGGRPRG